MGRLEGRQGHWSRKGGLGEREVLVGLESGRLILMGQACDALWTVLLLSKPQLRRSPYGWPTAQGNFHPSASARGPCHVSWPLAPFLEHSYLAFKILLKLPSVVFSFQAN